MRLKIVVFLSFLFSALAARAESEYHFFTDTQGRSIEAKVIRYDDAQKKVTIEPKGRSAVTVPIATFSPEDQSYVVEWSQYQSFLDERLFKIGFSRINKKNTDKTSEYSSMVYKYTDYFFKISLENKSTIDFSDVTLEYVVFYSQEMFTNHNMAKENHDGTLYAKDTLSIPKKSSQEFETKILCLATYRESGYGTVWPDLNSEIHGIIVKLSMKTKSGETITREARYPAKPGGVWTTKTTDAQP